MTESRPGRKGSWQRFALLLILGGAAGTAIWWYGPWNAENRYKHMDLVSLHQMLDANPKDFAGWKQLGLRLAKDGDRMAADPLQQAYNLKPADPEVGTALGELLLETGRIPDAFQILKATTENSPKFLPARLALGRLYSRKGSYLHATEQYEAVVALDAKNADAWYELADCYFQDQQSAKAQDAITRALQLEPGNPMTLMLQSRVNVASGKVDEGIAAAKRAAVLAPQSFPIQKNLVTLLLANSRGPDDLKAAEQNIGTLEQLKPQDPILPFLRGELERQRQHWDVAVRYLERAIALSPDQDEIFTSLSQTYRHLNRGQEADRLDAILKQRQDLAREMDAVKTALGATPNDIRLHIRLADLQVLRNDRASAISTLQNTLLLAPQSAEAQQRLRLLLAHPPQKQP